MPGIRHKPVGSDLSQAEWEADDSHIVDSLNVGSATGAAMGEVRASGALYASAANLGSATGAQSGELRSSGLIFTAGLNVGSATGAGSGEIRTSGAIYTSAINVGSATGAQSGEIRASGSITAPRTRSLYLPAWQWSLASGSGNFTVIGFGAGNEYQAWVMPKALSSIVSWIRLPDDYHAGQLQCIVYWTSASATSGQVRMGTYLTKITGPVNGVGDDLRKAADASLSKLLPAPTTAGRLRKDDMGVFNTTVQPGILLRLYATRFGADSTDTMSGDAYFIGMELVYTAAV